MNWSDMSIVQIGRSAGVLIIVIGTFVSGWIAFDQEVGFEAADSWRFFLQNALQWLFSGTLVIILAEVAERIGFWSTTMAAELDADEEASAEPEPTA